MSGAANMSGRARVLVSLALVAAGWRVDGSGVSTAQPTAATWEHVAWHVNAPAGNGTPVLVGDLACFTSEPTTLVCVDRVTGRERWRAAHSVVDSLPAAAAAALQATLARAPALRAQLAQRSRDYSLGMRALRSGAATPTAADLRAISDEMAGLRALLDGVVPYETADTHDEIGWASPSPATDGRAVFALFANGVVVRHESTGVQTWTRWLGAAALDKLGYRGNDAASPVMAGGLLIVPFRNLTALDPATGRVVWIGPRYAQYGTPAVARVGNRDLLVTPDGEVVDARTGAVVAKGLGHLGYTGPFAVADRVWFIGSDAAYDSTDPNRGSAWRLVLEGDSVQAKPLWDVPLPTRDRIYGAPVLWEGRLFVVSHSKQLLVIDASTGAVLHQRALSTTRGETWASPMIAGGHVFATTIEGGLIEFDASPPFALIAERRLPKGPGVMALEGNAVLWAGEDGLYRLAPP